MCCSIIVAVIVGRTIAYSACCATAYDEILIGVRIRMTLWTLRLHCNKIPSVLDISKCMKHEKAQGLSQKIYQEDVSQQFLLMKYTKNCACTQNS